MIIPSMFEASFQIRDPRIEAEVHGALDSGLLWPDPLIQLNPAFEPGDSIDELVTAGVLHEECGRIFRKDKQPGSNNSGNPLRLYKHQSDAIRCAAAGHNYVLTTGTASGKSLSYIVPVQDAGEKATGSRIRGRCFRRGACSRNRWPHDRRKAGLTKQALEQLQAAANTGNGGERNRYCGPDRGPLVQFGGFRECLNSGENPS